MYLQLFLIAVLPLLYYCWNRWRLYQKYYSQGLDGPRPWPFVGNALEITSRPFKEYEAENFRKYGDTYVDFILNNEGVIITSKPEYVKRILIKEFHIFCHRMLPPYVHKYARKSVIFVNEDWKRIRTQVTPVFTSGRLKQMFKNFRVPIETTLNNIDELIDSKKAQEGVDVKKLMKSFALDIIGNVVFSLKTNSFKDDDFAQKVMDLFKVRRFVIPILFSLPKFVNRFLKLSSFNIETIEYFSQLTLGLIEERKKNKDVVFNDFIELLLKSESDQVEKNYDENGHIVRKLTQEEIVGQAFIFFVAGMETISTALGVLLYELAINQDIQDKLYRDLVACHPDAQVDYDDLNKSKYLDNVISETLRRYTTVARVFRQAVNDYEFDTFKVKKGQTVAVSLYNLHMNEKLFPDPHKFKPERFDKPEEIPFEPIPFVDGPRNCIGNRFALVEMKSLLIRLVKTHRIFAVPKTDIPLRNENSVLLNMIRDITLGFERRATSNSH